MLNNFKINNKKELQLNLRRVLKSFLTIFLPSLMMVTGIAAFIYYHEIKTVENKSHILEIKEAYYVDQQVQIIVNRFNTRVSDLQILCGYQEMKALLDVGGDFHRKSLAQEFLTFSEASRNYDQIRFLDETGMETIRISFNDGEPYIVPKHQLQSKEGRYYFADTFRLNKGEVFVSPFDLNIEKGKIEIPVKPVIRFGTPVVDIKVQKRGIVIINYLGHKLIDRLKSASTGTPGRIMLLNAEGYWLHGERPEDEWGFMYEDRKSVTFANAYPDVWHEISVNKSGHIYNTNGLFTFATVVPLLEGWQTTTGHGKGLEKRKTQLEADKHEWKIVSHIMPEGLDVHYYKFLNIFFYIYGSFIVIVGFISWILANASVNKATRREEIKRSLREIEIINEELKCESEERKLVTNALQESEEKFRKISDTANDAIIMLDNDEKISYWNKSAEKIFGYSRDEAEEEEISKSIIPERFREKHLDGFEGFKATGVGNLIGKMVEVAGIRKDGTEIPIELSLSSVKIKDKWNAVGIIRDITERKKAERRLNAQHAVTQILSVSKTLKESSNKILQVICESLNWEFGGMWIHNRQDDVMRCSDLWHVPDIEISEFQKMTREISFAFGIGLPGRVWASGKPAWIVDVAKDSNFPRAPVALKAGLHAAFGFPVIINEKVLGILEFFSHNEEKPDNDLLNMMSAIGSQIALFIERRQVEDELMVTQKMSSIGRLAGSVFHEILNPVNIISSHTQLLLMEAEKDSNTEKDLKSIREEIGRIVSITEKLQEFSSKKKSEAEKVEINGLLENTLFLINPEMNLKSIKPITKFEKDLPELMAHGDELRQVFLNLITNAIDAMPEGGTLTVETRIVRSSELGVQSEEGKDSELKTQYSKLKGDFVRITFADTGCGIAEKNIDKIFEPFFSTKKEIKGVGLGLSTSYGIIESHGGTMSVESELGKGTTVTIDLPVKR